MQLFSNFFSELQICVHCDQKALTSYCLISTLLCFNLVLNGDDTKDGQFGSKCETSNYIVDNVDHSNWFDKYYLSLFEMCTKIILKEERNDLLPNAIKFIKLYHADEKIVGDSEIYEIAKGITMLPMPRQFLKLSPCSISVSKYIPRSLAKFRDE